MFDIITEENIIKKIKNSTAQCRLIIKNFDKPQAYIYFQF